ncbi:classical arabinogalactan protein 9-like [Phragmites australis]|uniref:classical arabinogalactan protein 9-like n=1 Tax=Phragmites australis TaxID=29695 RepID=UPI002D76D75E|nr:classical arabinogalactan protein 9-like [Phragmites australis]
MENVFLDQSSGSFEFRTRTVGRCQRGLGAPPATPRGAYSGSFPTCQPYSHHHLHKGSAWSSAPALPYARHPIYSSPSLPLVPSNQPPLLPLPPTATKYATFPCLPAAPPQPRAGRGAAATTTVPSGTAPAPRQRDRRRRPSRPPPSTEPPRVQKKKPLERATPLSPAPAATDAHALDDLEQVVTRTFVQDLLHALAPPPSSLPLPRFSLVVKELTPATAATRVVAPAAPSCDADAATADGIRGLLRL